MNTEDKVIVLERAVSKLARDLEFALLHLSDLESIKQSDKSRMLDIAKELSELSDTLHE